ncbi:hypothetical protein [Streptomyces scopuliridis]|uniref:hypothetical protein n=1 Tax=Streptomyces scopuliridis TaxID=452529 RepID=UPI0036C294E2
MSVRMAGPRDWARLLMGISRRHLACLAKELALLPGRMHDATAARDEGISICFQHFPDMDVFLNDGCLGLRRDHPGQAITPRRKPKRSALADAHDRWERDRHRRSSDRNRRTRRHAGGRK